MKVTGRLSQEDELSTAECTSHPLQHLHIGYLRVQALLHIELK